MTRITFILTFGLLIAGCNNMGSNSRAYIPEIMQPDWTGIDIKQFPVAFGHILKFGMDSMEMTTIVLDFSEDEGGQWIGVCFINENQLLVGKFQMA